MGKISSFAGLGLIVFSGAAWADLHFPQPVVELGEVAAGKPLRQRFAFINRGPSPIRIERLSAVCGCLTPKLEKQDISSGESGSLVLEVNTLTQPAGSNQWRVQVQYTEGDQEKIQQLYVSATLRAEIKVEPPKLAISTDRGLTHAITVTDLRPLPFLVTAAETTSPHLIARVEKGKDARTSLVHLELKESLPAGAHETIVSIFTDDPGYRELRVPVSIVKRPRLGVSPTPASVTLTVSRSQPTSSRVVLLRGEDEQAVEVEKIEVDNPALSCRWAPGPGNLATLKVSVDAAGVAEMLRGTVHVHVRKPAAATVSIPVICTVR